MGKSHDIEFDGFHALENFLDAYDDPYLMVVLEAIANALDAKADRIDIILKNQSITFRDNGNGMNKKQFKIYHRGADSNKLKGQGIGFAGIGAKLYLGRWKHTVITTETYGDDGALKSEMTAVRRKPKYEYLDTSTMLKIRGTSYGVLLKKTDYDKLQKKLKNIIIDHFNQPLLNELIVNINDVRLEPWKPSNIFQKKGIVKIKNVTFPVTLSIMKDDINPNKYNSIHYYVWGKTITRRKLDFINEVKDPHKKRIHVIVNAEKNSKHLKIEKNSFKSVAQITEMYKEIERWAYSILNKHGYIEKMNVVEQSSPKLSKFFQKLFNESEFKWLNPNTKGGFGSGGSKNTKHENIDNTKSIDTKPEELEEPEKLEKPEEIDKPDKPKELGPKKSRSGIKIIPVLANANESRAGWITGSDTFVYNIKHPLYRKYEKNMEARNQWVKSVLFTIMINHAITAKDGKITMTPSKVFDLHTKLMTYGINENF